MGQSSSLHLQMKSSKQRDKSTPPETSEMDRRKVGPPFKLVLETMDIKSSGMTFHTVSTECGIQAIGNLVKELLLEDDILEDRGPKDLWQQQRGVCTKMDRR